MSRAVVDLPLAAILESERLRPVESAAADLLAVSIAESGLSNPILVRPAEGVSGYRLVAGGHRLEAYRRLGRETIPAVIRELSDAEASLIEADENLIRRNLTPLERAESIAARLDAWGRRYPDRLKADAPSTTSKRGRPSNGANLAQFLNGRPAAMGFAEETAEQAGFSRRTIFNALAAHRGLAPALRRRLAGTWIGRNEGALRQLASIGDPDVQARTAERLLDGTTKSVSAAQTLALGGTPVARREQDRTAALKALWAKATPAERSAFLTDLSRRALPKGWRVESDLRAGRDDA